MQGIIYVKVALRLNADVDEKEAQEIVNEMDYDFQHRMICDYSIESIEEN